MGDSILSRLLDEDKIAVATARCAKKLCAHIAQKLREEVGV